MIDHEQIALDAGLRYLPAGRPGIHRRRRGRGFGYARDDGRPVGERDRERIAGLVIPPAWTDVWIAPEPDAHLQATGLDDRGRRQHLYHPAWRAAADVAKFERLAGFARPLQRLRAQVAADLRARRPGWGTAAAVRLIDDSLIRPGSMRALRSNGSVGATTLGAEHVSVTGQSVRLRFEGKSAVDQDVAVRDPLLARRLSDLLDEARPGEPLFGDDDGRPVDCDALNAYIAEHAGPGFTAKDLRTWGASSLAAASLLADGANGAERASGAGRAGEDGHAVEAAIHAALQSTADQLGNTLAVCRSAYVAPAVLDAYRSGELAEHWRRSRRARWLSRVEQTLRRALAA